MMSVLDGDDKKHVLYGRDKFNYYKVGSGIPPSDAQSEREL